MTFEEFAERVAALRSLPAREREREALALKDESQTVFALERGRALEEIAAEGRGSIPAYARELGVSRSSLDQPLGAWRRSQGR